MTAALFLRPRALLVALFVFYLPPSARSNPSSPKIERHVVVVVWDGMRPDSVSERHTPTLWRLTKEGVTFRNHHATYLSATVVNGTAIATGCYPSQTGVFANYVFRPEIEPAEFVDAGDPVVVRKGDELSKGKYLARPTTAEILHRAGKRSAIAGTKYMTVLHDRRATAGNATARNSFVFFQGDTLPDETIGLFTKALGPFPEKNGPLADGWTTKALIELMWKEGLPEYSLLWLSEPDYTQHKRAPGSPRSIAAMKSADEHLEHVLAALEKKGVRNKTDVFVVSDHGFSTIERSIDLIPQLNRAGFRAATRFAAQPVKGEIMVVGNGGTVLFYVIGDDPQLIRRLVSWLQQTDFAGVIFSREKIEGTFGLDLAKIDTPDAPDVVMAFRWNDKPNQFGVSGLIDADWNRRAGAGTHATLSRFDMQNLLIAAGPDFRRGFTDQLPAGNTDLAPTILRILKVAAPSPFNGRVLTEAMTGEPDSPSATTETKEATRDFPAGKWRQYLRISRVGTTTYFDEGNGTFIAKTRPDN